MSLYPGKQKVQNIKDYTSVLKELKGSIKEAEAKILLINFLKSNIGLTFQLLSGFELEPIQEIVLRGMFLKDSSLLVAGRGFSKSTLLAIFALLAPILRPRSGTCIISANFRRSRAILEQAEKMINGKKAGLLLECFPNALSRKNDEFKMRLNNGSEVFSLPLGEGTRGTRAQNLLLDEGLLISKDIQDSILRPFLTNKQNFQEEREIRRAEDELIRMGQLTEKDRISFPKNKYIIFSSASFTFEHLYSIYVDWVKNINEPDLKEKDPPSYFVMRASYKALPENSFLDTTQINAAKSRGGEHSDWFLREYEARFSSASSSYFNIQKLHECTVMSGHTPTIQLRGEKGFKYILACDPSYSASKSSDFFSFSVYLLIPQERRICLVHSYGKAGGELKEHFEYLTYLLIHFDIEFFIIDASGSEFITGYNESILAKERGINLGFLTANFDDSDDYLKNITLAKNELNAQSKKFVYGQQFNSRTIRTMHEHLQNQIEAKKVWFASRLSCHDEEYKKAVNFKLPFEFKNRNDQLYDIINFIDDQDEWIDETKNQAALIEVKATALGTLQYDLPQSIRRSESEKRPRKDNLTCLLLSSWASKIIYDIYFTETVKHESNVVPIIVR